MAGEVEMRRRPRGGNNAAQARIRFDENGFLKSRRDLLREAYLGDGEG
jgi:hypothetical protein